MKDALSVDPQHQEAVKLRAQMQQRAEELKKEAVQLTLMKRRREALQKISLAIETNPSVADYHILR